MEFVIETRDLAKSYGEVQALKALNLKVPKHSIFGFLGPNGAGKSTTIKLLLGLIKPTIGSAYIFGKDVGSESLAVRQHVGYLAQHPSFYPYMTAREVLLLSGSFFIKDRSKLEARTQEMLELVGLLGKADRRVEGFSGGETQRLGIAQAQIHNPEVLILDEPAAALDPMGREQVLTIMETLRQRSTIFFSTHILDDVQRISDQVAILNQGRLVAQAPTAQLLSESEGQAYKMVTRGEPDRIQETLEGVEWINHFEMRNGRADTSWRIMSSEAEKAEQELLRTVLANERVQVLEFGRERVELEEVFMKLVNGGK